ncbi:uncharacterized protein METZ01_LOCUS138239, partial [marine metagenome]
MSRERNRVYIHRPPIQSPSMVCTIGQLINFIQEKPRVWTLQIYLPPVSPPHTSWKSRKGAKNFCI